MKLYLVRHGESVANLEGIYAGQMDTPLTDLGRQQALGAGDKLKDIQFDKVFSSDLSRAFETCAIALPGSKPELTPILREYAIGTVQGKPIRDVIVTLSDDPQRVPDYTPYGGEDALMVRARARSFLDLLEKQDYACVAAFTHRGFMNSLLREVFGTAFKSGSVNTENCAIHVFEYNGNMWKLLAINYMTKFS